MAPTPWSIVKIDRLKELWTQGHSSSMIGNELGFTRNAIIGKIHRLQLKCEQPKLSLSVPRARKSSGGTMQRIRSRVTTPTIPLPPAPVVPDEANRIATCTLLELTTYACRYPLDQADGSQRYCGEKANGCSSYCSAHYRLCYTHRPSSYYVPYRGRP